MWISEIELRSSGLGRTSLPTEPLTLLSFIVLRTELRDFFLYARPAFYQLSHVSRQAFTDRMEIAFASCIQVLLQAHSQAAGLETG